MRDDIVQRGAATMSFQPLASEADTLGRLEPLAVPVGRFVSTMRRHAWVLILVFATGVGGTATIVQHMQKEYTSSATVLIQPQRTQVSDLQAISTDPSDVSSLIRTQIDIMRSPALAMGVVKALDLTRHPEFVPTGGGLVDSIKTYVRKLLHRDPPPSTPLTYDDRLQIAGGILNGKLSFANEAKSSVLSVSATTHDPKLSAAIANEVAKEFLDFKRQEKFEAMQRAHDWFQEQMGKLAVEVSAADRAVDDYRKEHRLDELPPDNGMSVRAETINRQLLNATNLQLAQVARDIALKQGALAQAQAIMHGNGGLDTLPQVLSSPRINELAAQIATITGKEGKLASTQGPANPELSSVRVQRQVLQARVAYEMLNVVKSLSADIVAARLQEQTLRQQVEHLRNAVSEENSALVGLQVPLTKARATRSIYESFLNRATQLANVAGIQEQDATLVSSARPPLGPSAPKSSRLIAVSAILSLVFGVALAFLIERLRSGFSVPEQIEGMLGLPVIGVVPKVSRAILRGRRGGRASVAFSSALDRLRGKLRPAGEERPKIIMVTSALPQEGKSALAVGLARNAAAAGLQVLVIECDFRSPSFSRQFGVPHGPGLRDILSGGLLGDTSKVIHEPEERLHVIFSGFADGDPQEQLASEQMNIVLNAMRQRYDLVLLDTPPVLPVSDALVLARRVDATLMVIQWEATARTPAQAALRLLHESRVPILGAIMSQVDRRIAPRLGGRIAYAFKHYDGYRLLRLRLG